MKILIIVISILIHLTSSGQEKDKSTDTLKVSGQLKNALTFTTSDFETLEAANIKDVMITNDKGVAKKMIKNLKGVLVKTLLKKADLQTAKAKELNEFYFLFVASDGYKVVFSWNEIFNTETGNNLYLITEQDGKKMNEMDERILILSTTDFITGRRYIKGLEKILVQRVDIANFSK